jgi:hypothetical protein
MHDLFFLFSMSVALDQNELIGAIVMICHWLPYANSAINPVIYNFMSGEYPLYCTILVQSSIAPMCQYPAACSMATMAQ